MRSLIVPAFAVVSMAGLTACVDTRIPDSAAHLPNQTTPTGAPLSAMIEGSSVSSQPLGGATPTSTTQGQTTAIASSTGAISDEQNFQAVSARETIESDAARRAANQAQYQQIQPTELPQRPRGQAISIVDYALSTTNNVGEAQYKRFSLGGKNRYDRNCASYGSPDIAQRAFLASGGPKRDRYGIDPDGDGFACGWSPASFRKVQATPAPAPATSSGAVNASDLAAAGITGAPQTQTSSSKPLTGADGTQAPLPIMPVAPLPGETLNISTE
ncbi:hypothetical protein O2N63_04690 [Aliiroseovarius sp. KMU-50]|uniref:Excalibur calcium-binding domain-containing protein n=1 Tax=Aliiroseovarius salicola TaxID=3009082 RepID=A0ABT4VYP3_9RHOB|nr:hypothetical protein [Aliiroseovarius sp. KMU-50]MDA5093380.1 hypothetical protein [Aliiroseovarius sp. KMU-50]